MKANAKQIAIFIQCQEALSLHFYCMIGFHKINLHSKDEFDLLPKHMQINLKSLWHDESGHNSVFTFCEKKFRPQAFFLDAVAPWWAKAS
jgi:hypothetical protein